MGYGVWGQGQTYVYADGGLAAEYQTENNNQTQRVAAYGWLPNGLWGTNPVWVKATKQNFSQPEYFYYQNDHLGTPQQVIDNQGNIVWGQQSTAFGETTVEPSSKIASNLRFPGQYFDEETNTHYNWFRDYGPTIGRYRVSDPIGVAGGINLYTYANNTPTVFSDSTGKLPIAIPVIGIVGGMILSVIINKILDGKNPIAGGPRGKEYDDYGLPLDTPSPPGWNWPTNPGPLSTPLPMEKEDSCTPERFNECREQWEVDVNWCDSRWSRYSRVGEACHRWAKGNFDRCRKGESREPWRL
jgi:RHS repeat-associated protein